MQKIFCRRTISLLSAILLIFVCAFFVLKGANLYAKNPPVRTIQIKLAISTDVRAIEMCEIKILNLVRKCGWIFKKRFGIRLKIKEIEYWKFDHNQMHINDWLNDLKKKVSPGDCDMVLGIISPRINQNSPCGIANYFQRYLLARYLRSEEAMKAILLHEMCHMFGAVDLQKSDSIMDIQNTSWKFDEFTSKIVQLNRHRSFLPDSFPLSEKIIDEAISLYKMRADLHPGETDISIFLLLVALYLEKQEYSLAFDECDRVLRLNPQMHEIHNFLGIIYFKQKEFEHAIEEYRNVLKFSPNSPDIHFNLGLVYSRMGMIDMAITEYHQALELNPQCAKAYVNLSHIFYITGRIEEAITMCQKALEISPNYAEALCLSAAAQVKKAISIKNKASILNMNGAEDSFRSAIKQCERALYIKPKLPEAHNIMGIGYAYQEEYNEAEREFMNALELNPRFVHAHYNLGIMYFNNNQLSKAAFYLRKTIELNPVSGLKLKILAFAFNNQNSFSVTFDSSNYPMISHKSRSPKENNKY